jgi:hypothetical protein
MTRPIFGLFKAGKIVELQELYSKWTLDLDIIEALMPKHRYYRVDAPETTVLMSNPERPES